MERLQNRLQKQLPSPTRQTEKPRFRGFLRADEGTRTLDLLHGKQTL